MHLSISVPLNHTTGWGQMEMQGSDKSLQNGQFTDADAKTGKRLFLTVCIELNDWLLRSDDISTYLLQWPLKELTFNETGNQFKVQQSDLVSHNIRACINSVVHCCISIVICVILRLCVLANGICFCIYMLAQWLSGVASDNDIIICLTAGARTANKVTHQVCGQVKHMKFGPLLIPKCICIRNLMSQKAQMTECDFDEQLWQKQTLNRSWVLKSAPVSGQDFPAETTVWVYTSSGKTAACRVMKRIREMRKEHVYSVLPAVRGNLKIGSCALGVSMMSELCLVALPQGSLCLVTCTHPWPG